MTRRYTKRERALDFFVDWVVIRFVGVICTASGVSLFLDAVYQSFGGR